MKFAKKVEEILFESKIKTIPFDFDSPLMGGQKRDESWMVPGLWLDRSGNVIPIDNEHSEAIKQIFNLEPSTEPTKALRIAYDKGWARIIINPKDKTVYVGTGGTITPSQKKNLKIWSQLHDYQISHNPSYSD